ncbi:hypothetical protein DL765_003948 [Monosporascus sp. GIB2]|nr:hypothetical protein DL765_003948 [Monosporascus sp. GIB2]
MYDFAAVDLLRDVEAAVEAVYCEHGETDDMIRQVVREFTRTLLRRLGQDRDEDGSPVEFDENRLNMTDLGDRMVTTLSRGTATAAGVFQELVIKAQIADDPAADELSRGFRLLIGATREGMQLWLVFAAQCLFKAHRVLGPELNQPFERLRPYARLIRGNIQANLNVRQPYLYRRETQEVVRDTIDEWISGDPLATMPNRAAGQASPSRFSKTTRLSAASCCTRCGRRTTTSGCPSATRRLICRRRDAPPRIPEDAAPQLRALGAVHRHVQKTRECESQAHEEEREEARGASTRLPHVAGAVPVGRRPPEGRQRDKDRREQHEERESSGPETGSDSQQQQQQKQRFAAAELLQKLLLALDTETAGHAYPYLALHLQCRRFLQGLHDWCGPLSPSRAPAARASSSPSTPRARSRYLSVGIFLFDVAFDNTAFRLDDHDPVTRAERKRVTAADVEGMLGRGALNK